MVKEPMTIFQETSTLYINANAFPKASFQSFELVSMIHNALELESSQPVAILMATKEMLKFGYKLRQGLKAIGRGSPALIELLDNKGRLGLAYKPTHIEHFQASRGKKRKCDTSRMSIPHIRTTFPAPTEVIMLEPFKELEDEEPDLARPKEFSVNSTISLEDNLTSTIRLRDAR